MLTVSNVLVFTISYLVNKRGGCGDIGMKDPNINYMVTSPISFSSINLYSDQFISYLISKKFLIIYILVLYFLLNDVMPERYL
jgi:hypothetical protein